MIDLAPNHKLGLPIKSSVLLAGGTVAYGEAVHRGLDLATLGGIVVGPITHYSQIGSEPPRLAETTGGFVLETGLQNRGVSAVVKKFARLWPRLGCPVIAQIADSQPEDAAVTARRLLGAEGLWGLELLVSPHADASDLFNLIDAIRYENDLPLWIKVPLERAAALAPAAAEGGADALVVGQPLRGAGTDARGDLRTGALYGPLASAPMLATLVDVARLDLDRPLIACGGIHTIEQAEQALDAGAAAVQLDSVVWVEPQTVQAICHWGAARHIAQP